MIVLGIESTCDETAASLVEDGRRLLSNVISTSVKEQALYGGVVPEIASRRHCEFISATVKKALLDAGKTMDDVDAVAVTFAPGLIGAVLVGVNFAKGLAYSANKPLVPVHHLRGHIAALYLTHPELKPPFLCLVASGGHSHIVEVQDYTHYHILGHTVDDAAGEAFDKVARTLGLPYPGGPAWQMPPNRRPQGLPPAGASCGRQVQRQLLRPENRRAERGKQGADEERGDQRA